MCLFCRIVAREIPSKLLFEDADVVAFHDVRPVAPVHVLVVPRRHVESLNDGVAADADLLGKLQLAAARAARETGIATSGWRLVVNNGPDACQSVFHVHLHVIGGRPMTWPPG